MFVCPHDMHWCDLAACRADGCRLSGEVPLRSVPQLWRAGRPNRVIRPLRRMHRGRSRIATPRRLEAMPRVLWKGAITFGLVHIPVELYPAEERKEFKFSMLDKRDFSPVGYKRYSKTQRQGSRVGQHRQGLRIREGPVRRALRRGLPARERQGVADDRHRGVRSGRRDSAAILRDALLPRADRARAKGLCAAAGDAALDQPRRRRAGRDTHGAASRRRRAGRQDADAQHAALRGRASRPPRTWRCRRRA